MPFSENFGMNVFAGMGLKWCLNIYTNIVNPEIDQYPNDHDWFGWKSYYRKERTKINFEPNLGVKFLYIF